MVAALIVLFIWLFSYAFQQKGVHAGSLQNQVQMQETDNLSNNSGNAMTTGNQEGSVSQREDLQKPKWLQMQRTGIKSLLINLQIV